MEKNVGFCPIFSHTGETQAEKRVVLVGTPIMSARPPRNKRHYGAKKSVIDQYAFVESNCNLL